MNKIIKEACVNNFFQAKVAFINGADRVELCDNIAEGGTTPSYGTIKQTILLAKQLNKEVVVMIRPRGGDFQYSQEEIDIIKQDIEICSQLNVDQIVTGVLTKDNTINEQVMSELIYIASPMKIVFHMAFDLVQDHEQSIGTLINLGVKRILTRGGKGFNSAIEGKLKIKEWIAKYPEIDFLPGGGVTEQNYLELCEFTGARQVHGTRIVKQS